MEIGKKEKVLLETVMQYWKREALVDEAQAEKMLNSVKVKTFDSVGLSRILFWISAASLLGAFLSLFSIEWIAQWLYELPRLVQFLGFAALTLSGYLAGFYVAKTYPGRNDAAGVLYFLSALFTMPTILLLIAVIYGDPRDIFETYLMTFQSLILSIYTIVAFITHSVFVWLFAITTMGNILNVSNGYNNGSYFIFVDKPLVVAIYGLVLVGLASLFQHGLPPQLGLNKLHNFCKKAAPLYTVTLVMGLVYFFLPLLILTIWGVSVKVDFTERMFWVLALAIASGISMWHGLRFDNSITKGFGVTFFMLNLYTRYFEFFWSSLPKTIFFALIALFTWLAGWTIQKWLYQARSV